MMLAELQKKAGQLLTENASALLTAGGIVGTIGTAVLTARAQHKASAIVYAAKADRIEDPEGTQEPGPWQVVKVLGPFYVPPVLLGTATIASIFMANQVSAKKAAALAAAYGISENRLAEYKEKVAEKLTGPKNKAVTDEIAQEKVDKNPPQQVIMVGDGDVLFYDELTARYFRSSVEKIKKAEAMIHNEIYNANACSMTYFCEEVGLPATVYTDMFGWNIDDTPNITFSATITEDDRPCMVMEFSPAPKPEYARFH